MITKLKATIESEELGDLNVRFTFDGSEEELIMSVCITKVWDAELINVLADKLKELYAGLVENGTAVVKLQ